MGFDFALNRFNQRYIDRESFNVSWSSVRRNLKSKWVVDNDEFATNQFLHPYQGSIYHTAARSAYNLSHRRSPVRWPLETVLHCDRAMRIPAVLTQEIHRLSTDEIKICRDSPVLSEGLRVADF